MVLKALAELQDLQPATMAAPMMSLPAEEVLPEGIMGDLWEVDSTALNLQMLAFVVATLVLEA